MLINSQFIEPMPKVRFNSEITTGTLITIFTMLMSFAGMWYGMASKIAALESTTKSISAIVAKHDLKIDDIKYSVIRLESKEKN